MNGQLVNKNIALLTLFVAAILASHSIAYAQAQIPIRPPVKNKWIVDLTGQVPADAVTEINLMCTEIFEANNRELVVVVINSTEGREHREYATQLFNQWGIGSAFKDNGILLLAALGDRRAEIIVGDGVDYDPQVRSAEKIMDTIIVPGFKQGDIGGALYEGARACATRILSIASLQAPRDLRRADEIRGRQRAKPRWSLRRELARIGPWPWIIGFGFLGVIGIFWFRHFNRYRARGCPVCGGDTVLLSEEQDDQFLDRGESVEEHLGSVDYDVWACLNCEEVVKIRYGKWFTRYSKCPKCRYKTRFRITRTVVQATTSHGGRVRVDEDCRNCDYRKRYSYSTPRISVSSGSSGKRSRGFGFGRSGSSGRSFGGGGRFGGGRSSGRGASGGW